MFLTVWINWSNCFPTVRPILLGNPLLLLVVTFPAPIFPTTMTVPDGKIIKLTLLNFTLVADENHDCAGAAADSARVFITNVASHGGNPNDFKICGQKHPPPLFSEGNFIQVRFESRTGLVNKGFNATFQAIDGDSRKSFSFRGSL